jgi:predicted ArsR family transcriptional regulator
MSQSDFSNRRVAGQIGVHYSVIDRHMQCLQATGMVDERPRSGRARKTTLREDRLIAGCVGRNRFQLVFAR